VPPERVRADVIGAPSDAVIALPALD
jgi:hypothetical protein